MKIQSTTFSLMKLPASMELTVLLLKEELRSRKFFSALRELGLDDTHYQTDLHEVIMKQVGWLDESNETIDFYYELVERHSGQMEVTDSSMMEHAFRAYMELVAEKERKTCIGS